MLNFTSASGAVRVAEHIEIEELRDPIIALPESGSPTRPALNYLSNRCVLTGGIALIAGVSSIVAAACTELDPKLRIVLCTAGGTAILASCSGLICRIIAVQTNRRNEATQRLLPQGAQIQMSHRMKMQPQSFAQTERGRLLEQRQNFQELLCEAPPFVRSHQEVLAGAMQIALEDSIGPCAAE